MKVYRNKLLAVAGAALLSAGSASAQSLVNIQGALVDVNLAGGTLSVTALSHSDTLDVSVAGNSLVNLPNSASGDPLQALLGQLERGETPVDGLLGAQDLPLDGLTGGGQPSLPGLEVLDQLAGGGGDLPLDPAMLTELLDTLDLETATGLLTGLLAGGGDLPLDPAMLTELLDTLDPESATGLLTGLLAGGGDLPLDPAVLNDVLSVAGDEPAVDVDVLVGLVSSLLGAGADADAVLDLLFVLGPDMLPLDAFDELAGGGGDVPLDPAMLTELLDTLDPEMATGLLMGLLAGGGDLPLEALDPVTGAAPVDPVELATGLLTGSADNPAEMLENLLGATRDGSIIPSEVPDPGVVLGLLTGLLLADGDLPLDANVLAQLSDSLALGAGQLSIDVPL